MNRPREPWWPLVVMLGLFAITRWPGLMPPSFSAAYALVFCVGACLPAPRALGWTVAVMVVTDLTLCLYYQFARDVDCFTGPGLLYIGLNYAGYAVLYGLGRGARPAAVRLLERYRRLAGVMASTLFLLGGGLLGAIVFYVVTNTASWLLNPFHNPEYTRDLAGWFTALTLGTKGHPPTWEFFRNTLLSGGLFSALFAGSWAAATRQESAREKESTEPEEAPGEPSEAAAPEEARV